MIKKIKDSYGVEHSIDYNALANKPELFSGNYEDLTNKPNKVSSFNNDSGYISEKVSNPNSLLFGRWVFKKNKPTNFTGVRITSDFKDNIGNIFTYIDISIDNSIIQLKALSNGSYITIFKVDTTTDTFDGLAFTTDDYYLEFNNDNSMILDFLVLVADKIVNFELLKDYVDNKPVEIPEHTHSEYAKLNHTHSDYASESHTHSEYANISHNHNDKYYQKTYIDTTITNLNNKILELENSSGGSGSGEVVSTKVYYHTYTIENVSAVYDIHLIEYVKFTITSTKSTQLLLNQIVNILKNIYAYGYHSDDNNGCITYGCISADSNNITITASGTQMGDMVTNATCNLALSTASIYECVITEV